MVHQYIDANGIKRDLSQEQHEDFIRVNGMMLSTDPDDTIEEIEEILKNNPNVVNYIRSKGGSTALHLATDILTPKGKECMKLLLKYGANPFFQNNLTISPLDRVNDLDDLEYKAIFLDLMYNAAKTPAAKREIDPLRAARDGFGVAIDKDFSAIQQFTASRTDDIKVARELADHKSNSAKKSCTIMLLEKIIYDNELLHHPKIQKMLEVAKTKSMVSEILELGKDKDIADAIISAIEETKIELRSRLFLGEVEDEETDREIDDQLADISIEKVLSILLAKNTPTEEIAQKEETTPPSLSQENNSTLVALYDFIQNVISIEAIVDAAKILEILQFMMQTSGNNFIGGYHGGNPDDDFGGSSFGGSSIVYDNNDKLDNATEIFLPVANFTLPAIEVM